MLQYINSKKRKTGLKKFIVLNNHDIHKIEHDSL